MSIKYEPSKLVAKLKLRKKVSKLVTANKTINREAFKALTEFGVLPQKTLEQVALGVIKAAKENDRPVSEKQLAARVQSAVLYGQTRAIKKAYEGERYRWLASVAATPRDEHIPNYGKIFTLGVGDRHGNDPGDLHGCQCGIELLVDDSPDDFNDRLEEVI